MLQIPNDPYDGNPLRLRRLADGIVIYCVGPDLIDNGGKLDRRDRYRTPFGADVGFQLWDPAHRRQASGAPPINFTKPDEE
jgi:hypothetical protein